MIYPESFALVFSCAFIFCIPTSVVAFNKEEAYQWKTGLWGTCNSPTKCGEGHRLRKIRCQHISGFAVDASNCDASSKPSTIHKCFRVCEHHKEILRWRVGRWSDCTRLQSLPVPKCTAMSISGTARRSVECVLTTNQRVVDSQACEHFWDKPESEMSCSLDCPQGCVTATRNITCQKKSCSSTVTWTEEVSEVIVAPESGGSPCPADVFEPVCEENSTKICGSLTTAKKQYRLKIGKWSQCVTNISVADEDMHIAVRPFIGISQREVTCINEDGNVVDISLCKVTKKLALERLCLVPQNCLVSPWSEWRVEKEGCVNSEGTIFPETRVRSRNLLQMPLGVGSLPCPPLYEERIVKSSLPTCSKYQWQPHEWSECEVRYHGSRRETTVITPTCGSGLQYRNVTCVKVNDMIPVQPELCKEPQPPIIQRCNVSCRRDCQVSHWGRWGLCWPFNNTNFNRRVELGYRRRVRSVLVNPVNGGKSCPHLEELEICRGLEIFDWQYGNWSDCSLYDPSATCGDGKKTRGFTCVQYNGMLASDEIMCHRHRSFLTVDSPCRVLCPNDCVVSPWSSWSICSKPCESGEDDVIFTRNRTILAIPGEGGVPCPKKYFQRQSCNEHMCEPYRWSTGDWGACLPNFGLSTCGTGVQQRDIFCTVNGSIADSPEMCEYLSKPETERECNVSCPVDCLTTNFTEWTPCEDSCDPSSVQYRHRVILRSPNFGGRPCPEALVEARSCYSPSEFMCPKTKEAKSNFRWKTGSWGQCLIPFKTQACGMGFQVRNVSCVDSSGRDVEPHFCLHASWQSGGLPSAVRSCQVTCSSECVLTAWSAWTPCDRGHKSRRTRSRELVGSSALDPKCIQKFDLEEEELCPVIPANAADQNDNHWMSCLVDETNQTLSLVNGQLVKYDCGEGYQYRFGFEINKNNGVEPGLEVDFCWKDCPVDCVMTSWSEWTECNVPCGQGFMERRRRVVIPSNYLGRPCPETVNNTEIQRDVCTVACADYHWYAAGWSSCTLSNSDEEMECGNGTQYRSVKCLNKHTDQEVDESKCDPFKRPDSHSSCRIHCPGECVVSSWRVAKECSEPCSSETYLEMTRKILRKPNTTSEHCPSLVSRIPCVLNETCHEHSWVLGPWGSCVLSEGAHCGKGLMKRPLTCLRSDGRQVDAIQCEKTHKPLSLEEPISKPCYIDCPSDCVMSDWSAWNDSSCTACGHSGAMTRTRHVLEPGSDAGQPCSTELEQKKPCPFKPCYHWKHSDWSQCDLQGADCGYGVRRRVVECIRYDGLNVDKMHCFTVNVTFPLANSWLDPSWLAWSQDASQEEELCHVPCPGDCVLTQWTPWGHCQKNCRIGQNVGYQTSSRRILSAPSNQSLTQCNEDLWRIRPCWSNDCHWFRWALSNDSFVCESRDGRIARGGCQSLPRPCWRGCEQKGGRCDTGTGLCRCEDQGSQKVLRPGSSRCALWGRGPRPPANHSAPTSEIRLMYYPDDSQASIWMYAMISTGTAFVIFVVVTIYLMCRSSLRQRTVSVERQPSVRRRANLFKEASEHSNTESAMSTPQRALIKN